MPKHKTVSYIQRQTNLAQAAKLLVCFWEFLIWIFTTPTPFYEIIVVILSLSRHMSQKYFHLTLDHLPNTSQTVQCLTVANHSMLFHKSYSNIFHKMTMSTNKQTNNTPTFQSSQLLRSVALSVLCVAVVFPQKLMKDQRRR
jgi:hypothetical protein